MFSRNTNLSGCLSCVIWKAEAIEPVNVSIVYLFVTFEVLVSRCEYQVFVYMPDKVCIRLIAFRLPVSPKALPFNCVIMESPRCN